MFTDYLVSYGLLGDFGRFRAAEPIVARRGDRVVVRTPRGLEAGEVMSPASTGHARFLPEGTTGPLLRFFTPADEQAIDQSREHAQEFFSAAKDRAMLLDLPLEVIDAEVLLDREHAVLHLVRWEDCDVRPLVSGLSKQFGCHVLLQDLTRVEDHHHGCSSCGSGGCESGGCSTGGCGTCGKGSAKEVQEYFAGLREQMHAQSRVALL